MPLLNIEEFKTKKIVEGASCPKCGGALTPTGHKPITGKLIRALSLGVIKPKSYECKECKRIVQAF